VEAYALCMPEIKKSLRVNSYRLGSCRRAKLVRDNGFLSLSLSLSLSRLILRRRGTIRSVKGLGGVKTRTEGFSPAMPHFCRDTKCRIGVVHAHSMEEEKKKNGAGKLKCTIILCSRTWALVMNSAPIVCGRAARAGCVDARAASEAVLIELNIVCRRRVAVGAGESVPRTAAAVAGGGARHKLSAPSLPLEQGDGGH